MPVLLWLTRLVGATAAWLVNLVLSLGLFLLSSHLFAQDDADAAIPAYVLRAVAAAWLFGASWHYAKHGILQRPKPSPAERQRQAKEKPGVLGTLGCLAMIAAIVATGVVVGRWGDWVYTGLTDGDASHPVQRTLGDAERAAEAVAAQPEVYAPYGFAVLAGLVMLRVISGIARRHEQGTQTATGATTRTTRRRRRDRARPASMPATSAPAGRGRPPAPAPVPAAVSSARHVSNAGRTITEPMLGTLRRDDEAGGWRLQNPRSGVGDVLIQADGEPSEGQLTAAHAIVQRSFEVLLRASEAAAPAAQANGVGLPRFSMIDSTIHAGGGRHPRVTTRLRCDADPGRVYEVSSSDGMHTFS